MTKFLSDCLEAPEPFFRQGLRHLEAVNAHPNTDIRVSLEVKQSAKLKLQQLGLDPVDTTAAELYYSLQERVRADDTKLVKSLRSRAAHHVSAEADVVDGMVHALKEIPDSKRTYSLKPASFRAIIKQLPPKKTMKRLGYRSLESFLKHESPAMVLAGARLFEGEQWHSRLLDKYKKLQPGDFEDSAITILRPGEKRWRQLSASFVSETKHNILAMRELGAIVFLPLPHDAPAGTVTASLSLALHELNEIRAGGTFLKLCQVRPDFGELVRKVAGDEPHVDSSLLDMSIPWNLIQRYYSKLQHLGDVFSEPHLELEDVAWHPIESSLKTIEPTLSFWHGSDYLAVLHNHKPVSLNLLDTALNCCNQLSFENRLVGYFQNSLWHELLLRYMRHDVVEQTVMGQLQPKLALEAVPA